MTALPTSRSRRRTRVTVLGGAAALTLAAVPLVTSPTAAEAADVVSLIPVRQIGEAGHAELYGWGVAYDPTDRTMLVGDYWNFRVARYALDGTFINDVVTDANQGGANNQEADEKLHQSPYGLGVDPVDGSFYFGDVDGGKTVDKYAHDGGEAIMAFGGNGTGAGQFQYPSRVAIHPETREVYVVDQWGHTISVHDPVTGAEKRSFGGQGTALGKLQQPRGAAFARDAQGKLLFYVTDNYNARVQVFDPATGQGLRSFGGRGDAPGQFGSLPDLRGLAVDQRNGWVYVANTATGFVNKYTLAGEFLRSIGGYGDGGFVGGPREVAVDGDGNIWVGDMPGFRAVKFSPNGELLLNVPVGGGAPPAGGFNQPRGVAVDARGNIFVNDTHNFRVQKFGPAGTFVKDWGHRGGGGLGFNYARGIDVELTDGDVFVMDSDNHKVVKFDNTGTFQWEVGRFGAGDLQFKNPQSLSVDNRPGVDGRIYVADTFGQRVVVLEETGDPTNPLRQVMAFGSKGNLDGQFQTPRSVTVDPADGTIWVSDSGRGIVQQFSTTGQFIRKFGTLGSGPGKLKRAADIEIMGDLVVVADVDDHQIEAFDKATGAPVTTVGGGGRELGRMFNPHGMDVSPDGNSLYVVEQTGERVQEFRLHTGPADTVAPTVAISSPGNNATVGDPVTLTGSASDDVAVASVEVAVRNRSNGTFLRTDGTWGKFQWHQVSLASPGATETAFSYLFDAPADGSYAFQVRSTDTANNRSPAPQPSRQFTVASAPDDNEAPRVLVTAPGANVTVTDPNVRLEGSADDNVGVDSVLVATRNTETGEYLRRDGSWGSFQWHTVQVASPGARSTAFSHAFTAPSDGRYAFQVRSVDTAGLRSVSVNRPFQVSSDASPPTVQPTTPAKDATVQGPQVTVGGNATDNLGVDGVQVAIRQVTTGLYLQPSGSWGSYRWLSTELTNPGGLSSGYSFTFSPPASGGYAFRSQATDSSGNISTVKPTRTFDVG